MLVLAGNPVIDILEANTCVPLNPLELCKSLLCAGLVVLQAVWLAPAAC
jgi:hypothetical protein